MRPPSESTKRWLVRGAKVLILTLLVWGLWRTMSDSLRQLAEHPPKVKLHWLALAGVVYLLGEMPSGVFWQRVMVAAKQPIALGRALLAFYLSQAGKYAPGKALVIVLRAAYLRAPGVETTVVAASVFIETLTTMAVGAAVSMLVLIGYHVLPHEHTPDEVWIADVAAAITRLRGVPTDASSLSALGIFIAAAMTCVTSIPTIPAVFRFATRALGIGKINATAADKLGSVPARVYLVGWPSIAIGWFVQGLSMWAVLNAIEGVNAPISEAPLFTATIALSVVTGFLSLIPGGFLGQEYVRITFLTPFFGNETAVAAALILRLVWVVSEVTVSVILYGAVKMLAGEPLAEPTPSRDDL